MDNTSVDNTAVGDTTVRGAVYALLREFGLTTVFGNPGSTELPMFRDFPEDFRYVLGLQDPWSSPWPTASRKPAATPPWSICIPPSASGARAGHPGGNRARLLCRHATAARPHLRLDSGG